MYHVNESDATCGTHLIFIAIWFSYRIWLSDVIYGTFQIPTYIYETNMYLSEMDSGKYVNASIGISLMDNVDIWCTRTRSFSSVE